MKQIISTIAFLVLALQAAAQDVVRLLQPAYADSQIWQPGLRTVAAEGLLASSSLRDKILRMVFHLKVKETINYDIGKLSGLSILTLGNDWKKN